MIEAIRTRRIWFAAHSKVGGGWHIQKDKCQRLVSPFDDVVARSHLDYTISTCNNIFLVCLYYLWMVLYYLGKFILSVILVCCQEPPCDIPKCNKRNSIIRIKQQFCNFWGKKKETVNLHFVKLWGNYNLAPSRTKMH